MNTNKEPMNTDDKEVSTERLLAALPFTVFALLCAAGTLFGILHRIFS